MSYNIASRLILQAEADERKRLARSIRTRAETHRLSAELDDLWATQLLAETAVLETRIDSLPEPAVGCDLILIK